MDVFSTRETREGWPLLTVETKVNGDSGSTYERGSALVGSLGLSCRYKRFLSCLGCPIVGPVQNILFPHRTLFQFICPRCPASQAASRNGSPVSYVLCSLPHVTRDITPRGIFCLAGVPKIAFIYSQPLSFYKETNIWRIYGVFFARYSLQFTSNKMLWLLIAVT